ncbi:MAG: ABC transporter ATP-binding protein [Cyanobacteriota bacterium]|nr:ABC transporter ATP-binding protein [Cyanobacteriota bacterium]
MIQRFRPFAGIRGSINKILHILAVFDFNWASESRRITIGVAAMILEVLARLVEPLPLKYVFDFVLDAKAGTGSFLAVFASTNQSSFIALSAIAVVLIALVRAGSEFTSTVAFAVAGNNFLTQLRARTFQHILTLSLRFHDRVRTGDLVTRVIGDMGRLQDVGVTAFLPLTINILTLFAMLVAMLAINPHLGLLAVMMFPLFMLFAFTSGRRIRRVARDQRKREGRVGAASAEAFTAIRTVQALGLEPAMAANFGSQNRKSARQAVQGKRLAARLERGVDVLIAVATALVLWRGALHVTGNQLTPGDLLVFLAYLKNAFKPMRDMAKYSGRIAGSIASAERVAQLLEEKPEFEDCHTLPSLANSIEKIEFRDVCFQYADGHETLQDINFEARKGELIALLGPSGAGKSTIVNLMLRLYDPNTGSIRFGGQDIRHCRLSSVRNSIAMVPQESMLFNASIADNISIGNPDVGPEAIRAAACLAGADDFILSLPNGYDTIVSERGTSLSGGQQRRIAIARAVVRNSPVLIMDEPLAGLDAFNRQLVSESISRIRQGRITFVILHDLKAAMDADKILFIKGGRIVFSSRTNDDGFSSKELEKLYVSLATTD